MNKIFLTGMARSGTTLLEKLLHNHPKLFIASQPYPLIYINIKKKFLDNKNIISDYPLENYFLTGEKKLNEFYNFLDKFIIKKEFVKDIFCKMKEYSGQLTTEVLDKKIYNNFDDGHFKTLYNYLINNLFRIENKNNQYYFGSKEIYCEEYLPYILKNIDDHKGIIIIRDPRDIITSLNFGKYKKYVGNRRPILFDLRNWRKSVAFSIYLKTYKNFKMVKYEDLVETPFKVLNDISNFLGIKNFNKEYYKDGIRDQDGNIWSGNSSFGNKNFINKKSLGRYKNVLGNKTIAFIETCTYPEMKYLNYNFDEIKKFRKTTLENFEEPFEIKRDNLNKYIINRKTLTQEITRYYNLSNKDLSTEDKRKWFIFKEVFNVLKEKI